MNSQVIIYAMVMYLLKGIVSRELVVCSLVSFYRSEVPTHTDRVRLLVKFRFRVEFLDFRVSA
jgi:hypothetical protein